jgi:hypothetical protein
MLWYTNSSRICICSEISTVQAGVVETDLEFERNPLIERQAVRLGDDGHDIHDLAEFFHHNDVDGPERMTSRIDEVQATMNACILDIAVTHCSEFLAKVSAVLILDVFDDRVPAAEHGVHWAMQVRKQGTNIPALVVDLVTITRSVDNVQSQFDAIFHDD